MNTRDNDRAETSASRRDFLKAASTLTLLGCVEPACGGLAPGAEQAPPGAGGSGRGQTIVIRGHHLFDMLGALGTGKSGHKTLGPVALKIRANPKVPIKLVIGVDDICSPCQWWDHKKSECTRSLETYPQDNANSMRSDANALRVLGMKPGDRMNADDLYRLIKAKVDQKVFAEQVCVACRLVDKCKQTYPQKIEAAVKALAETRKVNPAKDP